MEETELARPTTRPDLLTLEVEDRLLVLDEPRRLVHELDPLSAILWPLLDGTASLDDLALDVASAFGESLQLVRPQLAGLVRRLQESQLLVGQEPAPDSKSPLGYLTDPPAP